MTMESNLTELEKVKVFGKYPACPTLIFDALCPHCLKKLPDEAMISRVCPGCQQQIPDETDPVSDKLEGVIYDLPQVYCERVSWPTKEIKMVLTPLHHMTNRQIIEACYCFDAIGFYVGVAKNITVVPSNVPYQKRVTIADTEFTYRIDLHSGAIGVFKGGALQWSCDSQGALTQWYFNNNIAIPLYFESGHWANHKTAIDLGLAVPDRGLLHSLLEQKFNKDKSEIQQWIFDKKLTKVNLFDLKTMDQEIEALKLELQ